MAIEKKEDQNKLETLNVEVKSVIIKSVFEERRWTSIKSNEQRESDDYFSMPARTDESHDEDQEEEEMDSIFDEIQA